MAINPPVDATKTPEWAALQKHYDELQSEGISLKQWFADDAERVEKLSFDAGDLHFDLSKNLIKPETLQLFADLANTTGGFSGPAVFPVALRMVYEVSRACAVPVIGCGGVTTADDVIEMMMAGATAVEVGSANLRDPFACRRIVEELPAAMERLGIGRLQEIVGAAHP